MSNKNKTAEIWWKDTMNEKSLCSAPLDWLANDGCCPYLRKDLEGDLVCNSPMGPDDCESEAEIDEYMDFEASFYPY